MKSLSMFILLGFLSLSLFGFAGMLNTYDAEHAPMRCLASFAQNGACPPEENTVASAVFHTSAFKVFSTFVLAAALALIGSAFLFGLVSHLSAPPPVRTVAAEVRFAIANYLGLAPLRVALSRFELSPSR